ncbi:TPA: hypothetical protein JLO99_002724 [Escherichia coli]|nr:hypothetical protein [Escherichia coli]
MKHGYARVFVLLTAFIFLILASWVVTPSLIPVEQRGYICNKIERAPDVIKLEIDLCRKGLTKEAWQ